MTDADDSSRMIEDDILSGGDTGDITEDDADLSAIEEQMAEIEEEQKKLKAIQSEIVGHMNMSSSTTSNTSITAEEKAEADAKSVYVGNVDYGATAEDIEQHFHGCGSVARVTILCDKFSGHPKGFAYVEFADKEGMQNALAMSDSLLRGRQIKVSPKRTNKPGISTTNRPPYRGRGRGRGGVIVKYIYAGGGFRPRGRATRRRPGFAPY